MSTVYHDPVANNAAATAANINYPLGQLDEAIADAVGGAQNNLTATVAPTVNDDADDGYGVGSRWIDVTADKEYSCLDATVGAAIWELRTEEHGDLIGLADDDHSQYALLAGRSGDRLIMADDAATPPWSATERSAAPNTPTSGDIYLDDGTNTGGSGPGFRRYTGAVWEDVGSGGVSYPLSHELGGLEADVNAYGGVALITGGTTSEIKYNMVAAVAPTVDEDTGDGYVVGSLWYDVTNDEAYVCLDASSGAAVWRISSGYTEGVRVTHSVNLTIPTGTYTVLAFDTEIYDTDVMHDTSTNNSRLTCQVAGKYLATGVAQWEISGTSYRDLRIRKNGSGAHVQDRRGANAPLSGIPMITQTTLILDYVVGDYIELLGLQATGGDLYIDNVSTGLSCYFAMQRIG